MPGKHACALTVHGFVEASVPGGFGSLWLLQKWKLVGSWSDWTENPVRERIRGRGCSFCPEQAWLSGRQDREVGSGEVAARLHLSCIGGRGWGLWLDSHRRAVDTVEPLGIRSPKGICSLPHLLPTFADAVRIYCTRVGWGAGPGPWSFGFWADASCFQSVKQRNGQSPRGKCIGLCDVFD